MFGIGPMELMLIFVVALLVLGPKRMPELARTLGKGLSEFRRASNELRQSLAIDEIQNELRDGLAGPGRIHRPVKPPEADDKPAQAGDDLDPRLAEPAATPHPGELPPDIDPHAHHEDPEHDSEGDAAGEAGSQNQAGSQDEADGGGGGGEAAPRARPADPGLGTVPVSRTANRPAPQPPAPARPAEAHAKGDRAGKGDHTAKGDGTGSASADESADTGTDARRG